MTYDLTRCLLYLVPGAQFGTTGNDYALTEWKGPGVMPTEAECIAAWPLVQAQDAADAQAADMANANETTIKGQALTALDTNKVFLAINSPTNAQNAAQIKALTRQMNGLIRLVIRKLDGVG